MGKQTYIRLSDQLREWLESEAAKEYRTLSSLARSILEAERKRRGPSDRG